MLVIINTIYLNTTLALIPQCLYMSPSQTVFFVNTKRHTASPSWSTLPGILPPPPHHPHPLYDCEATVARCWEAVAWLTKGLFRGFAHIARLPSILLSNPFPSATKGGPVRNAGKVTPPPGRHVARHLFSQIFFFYLSSEVVIVCNVAPYFSFLLYFVSLFYPSSYSGC